VSRRSGLVVAAIVVAMSASSGGASVAWADQAPAPECTPEGGPEAECGSSWYTTAVFVHWQLNGGEVTEGCESHNYVQDTNQSPPPPQSGLEPLPWTYCKVIFPDGKANREYLIKVEISSPTVTGLLARPPDSNGWYNHPVGISFQGSAFSGIASCMPATTYYGPDTLSASASGSCTDNANKIAGASVAFHYDATPPTITRATPSRPPDYNGWYNHPVSFTFAGTDATSGIGSCTTTTTYAGPDSDKARAVGSCRDRAGNLASLAVPLRYQATPPALVASADAGVASVLLHWQASEEVEIVRSPGLNGAQVSVVYQGNSGSFEDTRVRDGKRYDYTLTARDQAGNMTVRRFFATPGQRLLAPSTNAHLTTPALLRWTAVRGASYYNVQLYRRAGKVLSAWPTHASLHLRGAWRFAGREYRLNPGRYRWYVWPGFGRRAGARYGRLIGVATFVVESPKRL
jgi:hypothetical protein